MDKDVGIDWLSWDENRCNGRRGGSRCRGSRGGTRDGTENGGHGHFSLF